MPSTSKLRTRQISNKEFQDIAKTQILKDMTQTEFEKYNELKTFQKKQYLDKRIEAYQNKLILRPVFNGYKMLYNMLLHELDIYEAWH